MFCKTCGALLLPKKTSYGKWLACPNGHTQPELNQTSTNIQQTNLQKGKPLEVMDEQNILAVHQHVCPKCGYDKAELIEIQPFYSDEDTVVRMRCGKCGCVEQMEGKVT